MRLKGTWKCLAAVLAVVLLYVLVTGDFGPRRTCRRPLDYHHVPGSDDTTWTLTGYQQPDFLWRGKAWTLTVSASVEPGAVCSLRLNDSEAKSCSIQCGEVGDRIRELRLFSSHNGTNLPAGVDASSPPARLSLVCDGKTSDWELLSPGSPAH